MRPQTRKYKELIGILEKYVKETEIHCEIMKQAGIDCVELMCDDPSAERCNSKLQATVENIQSALNQIYGVIEGLKLEAIEGVPPDWYLEQHPEWYDER